MEGYFLLEKKYSFLGRFKCLDSMSDCNGATYVVSSVLVHDEWSTIAPYNSLGNEDYLAQIIQEKQQNHA